MSSLAQRIGFSELLFQCEQAILLGRCFVQRLVSSGTVAEGARSGFVLYSLISLYSVQYSKILTYIPVIHPSEVYCVHMWVPVDKYETFV